MRRGIVFMALIMALLGGPALGQEATEAPGNVAVVSAEETGGAPVVVVREDEGLRARDWVLIGVVVVLALLLGTQNQTLVKPLILELAKSAPEWALKGGEAAARTGLAGLEGAVELTSTQIDDAALQELKSGFEQLIEEIRLLRTGTAAADSSRWQPPGRDTGDSLHG